MVLLFYHLVAIDPLTLSSVIDVFHINYGIVRYFHILCRIRDSHKAALHDWWSSEMYRSQISLCVSFLLRMILRFTIHILWTGKEVSKSRTKPAKTSWHCVASHRVDFQSHVSRVPHCCFTDTERYFGFTRKNRDRSIAWYRVVQFCMLNLYNIFKGLLQDWPYLM